MAEPLGSTTTGPETATVLDPGIQDAAQGLADQLDAHPGTAAPEPEPPAAAPEPPPAAPQHQAPRFAEGLKKFQGGYKGRIQRDRAETQRLRSLEDRYTQSQAETARLLQAATDVMRAKGVAEPEEEIPDPVLNPAEFQKWLLGKHSATVTDALKPVLAAMARQEERFTHLEQSRAAQAEDQERHEAATQQFLAWERDYQQESPDLAAGARERYTATRDAFGRALGPAGVESELQQQLAEMHLFAVASGADRSGHNGVAAMDGFAYGLYREYYEMVRQDLAVDGIQIPPFEGGGAAPAPVATTTPIAPAVASAPAPMAAGPSEIDRLRAVQQRTAVVGNAAPRVAGRAADGSSELQRLYRGGVRDPLALRATALKEAGGNMALASKLISGLIDEMG